jgi:hypothetical protein
LAHSDSEISEVSPPKKGEISEVSPPKKGGRKKKTMMETVSSDTESGVASAADTTVPPMSVDEIKTYMFSMTEQLVAMRKNMKPNMELSEDDLYLIQSGFMKFKEEVGALDKMITNVSIRAHKKISKGHISELKSATGSSSRKPKNDISEEEKETRRINSSINRPKEVISSLAEYINNRYGDNKDDFFEREITDNCYSPVEIQKLIRDVINEDKETNIAADFKAVRSSLNAQIPTGAIIIAIANAVGVKGVSVAAPVKIPRAPADPNKPKRPRKQVGI